MTVYEYAIFLADTEHKAPEDWDDQSAHPSRPVVNVSWFDAEAYCLWGGVRLPTEAEWERAARGVEGRRYSWGDDAPNPERANHSDTEIGSASPVGLFPLGATPENIADLTGNVWEWVSDWYDQSYYKQSPHRNPKGPDSGGYKGLRGGSWLDGSTYLRAALRLSYLPGFRNDNFGFRCVREVFP